MGTEAHPGFISIEEREVMGDALEFQLDVGNESLYGVTWEIPEPDYVAVVIHGYGDHIRRYDRLGAFLNGNGGSVLGIDQRGHGRSPGERANIQDFDDTVRVYEKLVASAKAEYPSLPFVLLGHSMGGLVSVRCAQRFANELAAIVVAGPVLSEWEGAEDLLKASVYPDVKIPVTELSRDAAVNEAFHDDPLTWHGQFREDSMRSVIRAQEQLRQDGRVQLPFLWLHGGQDSIVPYGSASIGYQAVAGPDSEEKFYPEAMHELFNEVNTDEVLTDVCDFIQRRVLD